MYVVIYRANGIMRQTAKFGTLAEAQAAMLEITAEGYEAAVKILPKR